MSGEDRHDRRIRGRSEWKRVSFTFGDGSGEEEFFVLEETKINGSAYILVTDSLDGDAECLILREEVRQPREGGECVRDRGR